MSDGIRIRNHYLIRLGHSTSNSTETKFSVLEMNCPYDNFGLRSSYQENRNNHNNIICNNKLVDYLVVSFGIPDERDLIGTTNIIIHRIWTTEYVVGVQTFDDKKYAVKPPIYLNFFFFLFIGIAFFSVYVGIIFLLCAAYELWNYLSTMKELKDENFVILGN